MPRSRILENVETVLRIERYIPSGVVIGRRLRAGHRFPRDASVRVFRDIGRVESVIGALALDIT